MKIKTNLYLMSVIFVVVITAIGFVVFHALGQINKEVKISNSCSRLIKDIFELNIVTNEYTMHHENRMRVQWFIKYNSLNKELEAIRKMPLFPEHDFILQSIITDYNALDDVFTQLHVNFDRRKNLIEENKPEVEIVRDVRIDKLMTSQLMMRSQRISTRAFKLSDMMQQRIYQVKRKTNLIILFSIIGFAVLSFIASFYNIRTLIEQIQKLIKGAEQIGEGNLEHKIVLKTANEMHQLAKTFNKMSEDLKASQQKLLSAKNYSENIVGTLHEPLIVLDSNLHVVSANKSFYDTFKVLPEETDGILIYELGNSQWNIPELKKILEDILPEKGKLVDYEVEHNFETIGKKIMLLNAQQITREEEEEEEEGKLILLAIEDITERKKVERGQIKSLAKFPSENPSPVLRIKKNGTILFANNAGSVILDYWGTQTGQSLPEDWHKYVLNVLHSKTSTNHELECNDHIFSFTLAPVEEEGYVNFYGLDITERKKAEKELNQYEHIVSCSADMLALLDKRLIYSAVNQSYLDAFNKSRKDVVGHAASEVIGKAFFEKTVKAKAEQSLAGKVINFQEWFDLPAFGKRYMDVTYSPYIDINNEVKGFVVISRNITERKEAENALKESEKKTLLLLNSTGEAIYGLDLEGLCNFCNTSCLRLLGYEEESQLLGQNMHELIHHTKKDDTLYPEEECYIYQAFREGKGTHVDDEVLWRADGTSFAAEYRSFPIFRDGETVGSVVSFVDITKRIKSEEQIKASLKEKEVLLMEVHHRVKNNMQVIASLLRLQSEGIKDKHLLDLFDESRNRIKSMALIHEDLYNSKDLASIDFDQYTRKLTGRLMTSFGVSPDKITTHINIDIVSLGVDTSIPCGLIVNELFTNSLKHAFPANRFGVNRKDKKGEICIDFHSNSGEYTLTFSDNGVGLPEGIDFHKTETLGLELVRMLVKQLKGTIELGRSGGAKFKIIFRV